MFAWMADPSAVLRRYDHFVAACAARGIKPLVVLFDDDFYDVQNGTKAVVTVEEIQDYVRSGAYKGAKWMANPGLAVLEKDAASKWKTETEYMEAFIGGSRANDSRLLGVDIMNEPHRAHFLSDFVQHMIRSVAEANPQVLSTEDSFHNHAAGASTEGLESALSYHSYWNYGQWQKCAGNEEDVRSSQQKAGAAFLREGARLQKPVLVSEMGQFNCYCPSAEGFSAAGVGWILWELMMPPHDEFGAFQGLVHANGTFRNASEAACLRRLAGSSATVLV
jgi:hypothetical protein